MQDIDSSVYYVDSTGRASLTLEDFMTRDKNKKKPKPKKPRKPKGY